MQYVPVVDKNQNPLMPTTPNCAAQKKCSRCGSEKPRSCFYADARRSSGLQAQCKACWKSYREQPEVKQRRAELRHKRNARPEVKEKHNAWDRKRHRQDPRIAMLGLARHRARRDGLPFNLRLEDIVIPEYCPVLGIKLQVNSGKPKDNSPSLDKKNSLLGYTPKNVQVISHRANRLKSNASIVELVAILKYMGMYRPDVCLSCGKVA